MWCDLGNLGDVRPGARTGMTRMLRFILIKTGKNEKQTEKKAQRNGLWSVFFPWASPAGTERCSGQSPWELCSEAAFSLSWEWQNWGKV